MQAYFEPEQAFCISMLQPVFEISIAYKKTCNKICSQSTPSHVKSRYVYLSWKSFEEVIKVRVNRYDVNLPISL